MLGLGVGWCRFGHAQRFDGPLRRVVGPHPKLVADPLQLGVVGWIQRGGRVREKQRTIEAGRVSGGKGDRRRVDMR